MDRRNTSIINKMTEVLNHVKGFEAAMTNPQKGKITVDEDEVAYVKTILRDRGIGFAE